MARKLTTEERLQRIAEEAKTLKSRLAKERREAERTAYNLLGEATWKILLEEEGIEGKADAMTRALNIAKHLPKKKADRLIRALNKIYVKPKPKPKKEDTEHTNDGETADKAQNSQNKRD